MLFVLSALFGVFFSPALAQIGLNNCSAIPGWDPVDALETANEPVLSAAESGFFTQDTLTIVWYNPNKTLVDIPTTTLHDIPASVATCVDNVVSPTVTLPNGDIHWGPCYKRCEMNTALSALTAGPEVFVDTSNPAETLLRGKLTVNNTEELGDVFRNQPSQTRVIISEFPFEITFPTSVSANLADLEVFMPEELAAALILQSVDVDVTTLGVDGRARIRTQLQWPYRFDVNALATIVNAPGININSFTLIQDCADPGVIDDSPQDDGTVPPCDQYWEVQLVPDPGTCQLDGRYRIDFLAECQPAFDDNGSNCPLVGPSGSLENNDGFVEFVLDSENFCPQLIQEVQITADLAAYKDAAFTQPADNYLPGQTIYFLATVNSPLVTLSSAEVQTITIDYQGVGSVTEYDVNNAVPCPPPHILGSFCNLQDLVVNVGTANTANFNFLLTTPPFNPPVDGDQDFNVTVLLDVEFQDVNLLEAGSQRMLLQLGSSAERRALAEANIEYVPGEEDKGAGAMVSVAVAMVLVVLAALM